MPRYSVVNEEPFTDQDYFLTKRIILPFVIDFDLLGFVLNFTTLADTRPVFRNEMNKLCVLSCDVLILIFLHPRLKINTDVFKTFTQLNNVN